MASYEVPAFLSDLLRLPRPQSGVRDLADAVSRNRSADPMNGELSALRARIAFAGGGRGTGRRAR